MPGIYLSDPPATETTLQTRPVPNAPAITSINLSDRFELGINTCGFTSRSTITCSFGSECTDVGSYRGCCVAGAGDCISTIYTTCLEYAQAALSGDCGNHTLCCPATMPGCFSYGYISTAEGRPDATLTHVQCHESAGFGEMFLYPPEWEPTTTADAPASSLEVQPTDDDDNSSSSSSSAGVIIGVAIGVVLLISLIGLAAFLIVRRRRRQRADLDAASAMALPPRDKESGRGDDIDTQQQQQQQQEQQPALGAGRLRPLSTIPEQLSPISVRPVSMSAAATNREKRKSTRRSFGPYWPLGSGNPLASHPVDLEKRLSDPRASSSTSGGGSNIPQIQLPPPPGSKMAPPPPAKSPRSSSSAQPHTPTSISAGLQSPRLSYVPVSPIDAALQGDVSREVDRRLSRGEAGAGLGSIGIAIGRSLSSRSARAATGKNDGSRRGSASQQQQGEPVSPIDDEGEEGSDTDSKRLSFVSAPSVADNGVIGNPDLVSPVSPEFERRPSPDNMAVSPVTVSPVESRRGSLDR